MTLMHMRPWLHLLRDSVFRGWMQLAGASVLFLMFSVSAFVDAPRRIETGADVFNALLTAFFVLLFGAAHATLQYPSYPLLAALPVSRGMRGRLVWLQHVAAMPAVLYATMGAAAVLAPVFGGDPRRLIFAAHPAFVSAILIAMASPALMLLVMNQPSLHARSFWHWLFYAPLGVATWWAFHNMSAPASSTLPVVYALGAAGGVVLVVSFVRAARLTVGPRYKQDERPVIRGPKNTSPVRLKNVGPLWQAVLVEPLQSAPLALAIMAVLRLYGDSHGVVLSVWAAILALMAFVRGGRQAAERVRLLRALPMTPAWLSTISMGYGVGAAMFLMLAGCLFLLGLPEASPATMISGVLSGMTLGSLAPALFVRFSRVSEFLARLYPVGVFALLAFAPFHWFDDLRQMFVLQLLVAALCLVAGRQTLQQALVSESAYQYRAQSLETMREG